MDNCLDPVGICIVAACRECTTNSRNVCSEPVVSCCLVRLNDHIESLSDSYKDSIRNVRHNGDKITSDDRERVVIDRNHEGAVHGCVDESKTISLAVLDSSVEVLALVPVGADIHTVHETGVGLWRYATCQRVVEESSFFIPVRQCEGSEIFIIVVRSRTINDERTKSSYTILNT